MTTAIRAWQAICAFASRMVSAIPAQYACPSESVVQVEGRQAVAGIDLALQNRAAVV